MSIKITSDNLEEIKKLKIGDSVLFSGTIYTARDAAHKKIMALIDDGKELPFDLNGAVIYYAGPTPTKPNGIIGSCGPTTSGRMDIFTPRLISLGLKAMIGKGERNEEVINACKEYGAVYLCAIGGAGALASQCVTECEVVCFEELGCESIKRLKVNDFPLVVGIDTKGNDLFKEGKREYCRL